MPPLPATPPRPSNPTPLPVAHPATSHGPSPSNIREDNTATRFKKWAVKNSIAVTGWLVAFASMIVAIVSLLPGFRGQRLSEKALELAEWTALKDYIEQCNRNLEAGVVGSPECEEISGMSLPPPPHVKPHSIDHIKRLISFENMEVSAESFHFGASSDPAPVMIIMVVFLTLLLIAVLLFVSFGSKKSLHLPDSIHDHSAEHIRLVNSHGFRYGNQQENTALPVIRQNETQSLEIDASQPLDIRDGFSLNHTATSSGVDSSYADNLLRRKRLKAAGPGPLGQTRGATKVGMRI